MPAVRPVERSGRAIRQAERIPQAAEDSRWRREGDLVTAMTRDLLGADDLGQSLSRTGQRLAAALALPWVAIELAPVEAGYGIAVALHDQGRLIGALVLPPDVPELTLRRTHHRVVPTLETLVGAALDRQRLQRSDRLKTAMLRVVSHDLRSQLTAIIVAAQGLEAASIRDADRHELAAVVGEEASRIAGLVDGLLDADRLESGAASAQASWCAVAQVLEAALQELGPASETFSVTANDEIPLVHADAIHLQRAFANLLANAARYSRRHPVLVEILVRDDSVIVRITDRGPGVPADARERVFEPFQREGTDPTGHDGSGLGLAIARGFVEANGGRIAVESASGGGAAFVVQLPTATHEVNRTTLRGG